MDDGDRANFCEAIADATHYVSAALDVLPRQDHFSFPELCRALNYLNDLNDEIQAHLCDADDDDDDAGDKALQEAYDIIAAGDDDDAGDDYTPGQIEALLIAEFTRGVA
jgi:chromosome condensin MukBEF ATPase and DNA-binding subunit MukB